MLYVNALICMQDTDRDYSKGGYYMYEIKGQVISLIAGEDITENDKYKPVYMSADNTCKFSGNSVTPMVGIVQSTGIKGEAVPVMISGVSMFRLKEDVQPGNTTNGMIPLTAGSNGDIIPAKVK